MKSVLLTAALLIFASSVFGQETQWKEFRSTKLNFSVRFPGEPLESKSVLNPLRYELTIPAAPEVLEGTPDPSFKYVIDFAETSDINPDMYNHEWGRLFDRLSDAECRDAVGAYVGGWRDISVNRHAGREVILYQWAPGVRNLIIGRIFIVKNRCYLVWAIVEESKKSKFDPEAEANLRKFVESFSFIN